MSDPLRPARLSEYEGQEHVTSVLATAIAAARARREVLRHALLTGPAGLGKTTLGLIVAEEMGAGRVCITSGVAVEKVGTMARVLLGLHEGDVLFIDEIHRLPKRFVEVLYPAMEDFCVDVGVHGNGGRKKLPHFTLIGATTREALLTGALRERFGLAFRLQPYREETLRRIVWRAAGVLGMTIDTDSCRVLARCARGVPRVVNNLLLACRDAATVGKVSVVTGTLAVKVLKSLGIDERGLTELDRQVLKMLVEKFDGGPVGLGTLAAACGLEEGTIAEVCEPELLRLGLIARESRGRIATASGWAYVGKAA